MPPVIFREPLRAVEGFGRSEAVGDHVAEPGSCAAVPAEEHRPALHRSQDPDVSYVTPAAAPGASRDPDLHLRGKVLVPELSVHCPGKRDRILVPVPAALRPGAGLHELHARRRIRLCERPEIVDNARDILRRDTGKEETLAGRDLQKGHPVLPGRACNCLKVAGRHQPGRHPGDDGAGFPVPLEDSFVRFGHGHSPLGSAVPRGVISFLTGRENPGFLARDRGSMYSHEEKNTDKKSRLFQEQTLPERREVRPGSCGSACPPPVP